MTDVTPKTLIACPMSYKLIDDEAWFTGASWILSVMAQDYLRFRIFVLAHNFQSWMADKLYGNAMSNAQRLSPDTHVEMVIRSFDDDTPPDVRGLRKKVNNDFEHFARLRNMVLEYALFPENEVHEHVDEINEFDYLISIDSDIMVHPDMVSRLVAIMEEHPEIGLCSIPVNNMRRVGFEQEYPNAIFNFGFYKQKGKTIEETRFVQVGASNDGKFPLGNLIPADYTGGACIIRLSMVRDNPEIRYGPCHNSEDAYLCYHASQAGFKVTVDTSQVSLHMMDPRIYERDMEKFNKREIV